MSGGGLSRGDYVRRGFVRGVIYPRGFVRGVIYPRGFVRGLSPGFGHTTMLRSPLFNRMP